MPQDEVEVRAVRAVWRIARQVEIGTRLPPAVLGAHDRRVEARVEFGPRSYAAVRCREYSTGWIGRITPSGTVTQFTVGITPNNQPEGIAAGPDGNLWFAETRSNQIGRITPSGIVTEYPTGITGGPEGITAGPDGNVWFAEGPDSVGRVDLTVHAELADLSQAVQGIGPGTSLADKVTQVQSYVASGDIADACATLGAFVNEVHAQSKKSIPLATADQLIAAAQRIQAVLSC